VIAAIVLAAGASVRMGAPKAGLPLGGHGETVLSTGVRALLDAGVPRVVIVAGAYPGAVRDAWPFPDRRVRIVEHADWGDGQLSSLLAGLSAVNGPDLEAVLVTLVDVPLVAPATIRAVIDAWTTSHAPIVRPARGDEHGHPVLFDRVLFEELARADVSIGAKSVVRAHEAEIVNVPVTDQGAFADMDTPEDYERLKTMAAQPGSGR
jgi:molybdenum cofactor cytidylyltransferase